jgi:hypothetical protein
MNKLRTNILAGGGNHSTHAGAHGLDRSTAALTRQRNLPDELLELARRGDEALTSMTDAPVQTFTSRPHNRLILLCTLFLTTFLVTPAHALTNTQTLGDLTITLYAPDWTWQKSAVNILITIENSSTQDADLNLKLVMPPEFEQHFETLEEFADSATLTIPANESIRHAFTNIIASGDVPRQTYALTIDAEHGGEALTFDYPLTTIRGPVVSTAEWAIFLPVIICASWWYVFVIVLKRFAKPGAWKTAPENAFDQDPTK